MKTQKTPKYTHTNQGTPYIHHGSRELRKKARTLVKSLRHKLLMGIPLTDMELHTVKAFGITKEHKLHTNNDVTIYLFYDSLKE